jgi:hypothetical protein
MTAATIVENAYSELLDELPERYMRIRSDNLRAHLVKENGARAMEAWPARLSWLNRLDVSISPAAQKGIAALAFARNAIAHAGGEFTSRQRSNYGRFIEDRLNV